MRGDSLELGIRTGFHRVGPGFAILAAEQWVAFLGTVLGAYAFVTYQAVPFKRRRDCFLIVPLV